MWLTATKYLALERRDSYACSVKHLATILGICNTSFAMPTVALAIELWAVGWQRWSLRCVFAERDRSRITDAVFFTFSVTGWTKILDLVGSFGFFLIAFVLASTAGRYVQAMHLSVATHSSFANAFIYVVLYTFCVYWNHRLVHSAILWPFHRLHHSGTRLSPLTASRNNPLEVAFQQFLRVWPIVLCPISITSLLTLNSFLYLHSTIHHIDVRWTWGWFGRWILVSPQAHRIHHSPRPEHFNKNFGTAPFWDHLFGTWYEGAVINDEVGLGEPLHNNRNLLRELGADVLDFGKEILHRSDVQAPALN